MVSALFAIIFAYSLLPGRKPLCLRFAEKISDGILPDGAEEYCRKLTIIWCVILFLVAFINGLLFFFLGKVGFLASLLLCLVIPLTFFVEGKIRRERFSVTFHTSGSTGKSKTIVKTFESLAKEVAYHRNTYKALWGSEKKPYFLSTIDPSHMYGVLWRVMLPKAMGVICDPEIVRHPEALLEKMREHKDIFLVTTPSFLERFTAYFSSADVPQHCIEIITSGGLLTKNISDETEKVFGIMPRQIFGSTETGGVASRRGDGDWEVFDCVKVKEVKDENSAYNRISVLSPYSFSRSWYLMGDGIELSKDKRSFRLLGRLDRLVKINEERINLPEMEDKIKACGFVDCALTSLAGARGPILGAVLVRKEKDVKATPNMTALELRKLFLPIFPQGTVPKRYRFVHSIPRNSQGKIINADVVRLLESSLVEPRIFDVNETENSFEATFIFDKNATYFQGHFPDAPILPGVVQIGLAVKFAEKLLGKKGVLKAVQKMKFMHIIEPEKQISFLINKTSNTTFTYTYKQEETICSSGVLLFS